jgi:hypothetical protein
LSSSCFVHTGVYRRGLETGCLIGVLETGFLRRVDLRRVDLRRVDLRRVLEKVD